MFFHGTWGSNVFCMGYKSSLFHPDFSLSIQDVDFDQLTNTQTYIVNYSCNDIQTNKLQ